MKIYFACAITGGREFEPVYRAIVDALLADGYQVPTAHLASSDVAAQEQIVSPAEVYARDVSWIQSAAALIAEVSTPSHGVGYEVGYALSLGRRVLCLYKQGCLVSKMITGNPHPNLRVYAYSGVDEAIRILREFCSAKQPGGN
jgi:nucleoside 2-deoxyribosyltransferase